MGKDKSQKRNFDNRMGRFISLVKKHEEMADGEIRDSWKNVNEMFSAERARKMRRKVLRYLSVGVSIAASAAILFMISNSYLQSPEDRSFLSELENKTVSVDSLDQICLVLSDDHQVELANESVVNYDKQGGVTVNNRSQAVVDNPSEIERNNLNHIIVPKGKRTHVTLSDGTKMYINSASHIIYPSVFESDKREIAVEGEVYLEVVRNPKAPFIVKTKRLDVKVLGTTFNVKAYGENDISVVLVDGRVEVCSSKKEKMDLTTSQRVSLKDGIMKKEDVNVLKYVCWKDNLMLLEKEPVSKVLEDLSRYYGVPVWCDKEIAGRKLSGKLDLCESIDDVLEIVKVSASSRVEKMKDGGYYFHE